MSYVVLARKWRPQYLKDLVGQQHIAETLLNALGSGTISHGFLFTGTRGVGKTSAARIFARALNCSKLKKSEPCGTCEICKSISAGNFIDVLEIDGASNRGVDDIRELREQVKYASMQGKYKVYIIDEVHMLTKEAFNALLKTLEEPPEHVIFIFATTEVRKVPQTILSRVQRFDFKRISTLNIAARLGFICKSESINAEVEALQLIAEKGGGSMRDALSYLDQVYAYSGKKITADVVRRILGIPSNKLFLELFEEIKSGNKKNCFALLENFYRAGIDLTEIASGLGSFFRNVLYALQKGMTSEDLGVSEEYFKSLVKISADISEGDVFRYSRVLSETIHELKTSHNQQLTLDMGVARMANLDKVVLISEILSASMGADASSKKKKVSELPEIKGNPPGAPQVSPESNKEPPVQAEPGQALKKEQPETNSADSPVNSAGEKKPEKPISIPRDLQGFWNDIVELMISSRPLVGNHFQETELNIEPGEQTEIQIYFSKKSRFSFVQSDKGLVKYVKNLLADKFEGAGEFIVKIFYREPPESDQNKGPDAEDETQDIPELSEEQLVDKEPIIGYILKKFDGTLME